MQHIEGFGRQGNGLRTTPETGVVRIEAKVSEAPLRGSHMQTSLGPVMGPATICDTLATESLGKPVLWAGNSTLPGAVAQRRLLVNGTQTTVASRLRLSASPCTISTGR